jgi:uncharacterized protein (DUF58 family)
MYLWKRFRGLWPGALRQQVTGTGVAYSVTIVIIALGAVLSANNLLFLILAAMLSILAVSGFVSKLVLAGLEIDLLLPPHIAARQKLRATLRLKNLKRWMPSFSIQFSGAPDSGYRAAIFYPVIPGGATLEEPLELSFPKRGRYRERTFQLTTRFPFGFAERRELVILRHEIVVYPCLDPQPGFETLLGAIAGEWEVWRRGTGHDFYRIRPYEALESARHVDWKATAHTSALQVREFARDEDHLTIIYLDLDVSFEQEAWFETALECAAFLAFRLSEQGHKVRVRTQDIDITSPNEGDVYSILRYLAVVTPRPGATPESPDEMSPFQVVLTANPERMASLGWGGHGYNARMLGLDAFATAHPLGDNLVK